MCVQPLDPTAQTRSIGIDEKVELQTRHAPERHDAHPRAVWVHFHTGDDPVEEVSHACPVLPRDTSGRVDGEGQVHHETRWKRKISVRVF